jgi:hypothetical protein
LPLFKTSKKISRRELNKIPVEIIALSPAASSGGAYAIVLKEIYGNRKLPIIIGGFEAQAISFALEGAKTPRPMTHDLLKIVIDHLGATVIEVIIDDLQNNTFHAKLILEVSNLTHEIDCRPSDAIALALRANASIYVREEILDIAGFSPSQDEKEEEDELSEDIDEEEEYEKNNPAQSKEAKIAALQEQLREAIEKEDYERAAKIRDQIKQLSEGN